MDRKNPVVLIHGYSDITDSFKPWTETLRKHGYEVTEIHSCGYRTLTNEVTIKDIAEGFDRALRINAHLGKDQPFDAIVHSTGMLVIRSWLTTYGNRKGRLKRLIGLAPASFGSPLAHKGRSWLGSIFKGNTDFGPDFLEAGDQVLDGLELGSKFLWELAHKDLLCNEVFYGSDNNTPYVFTFCGNKGYGGLRGYVVNPSGTDGTVRWAGCSLNTRKITLDFTQEMEDNRVRFEAWKDDERCNLAVPFIPLEGFNHATILSSPSHDLEHLVVGALKVDSKEKFDEWNRNAVQKTEKTLKKIEKWQQFIMHAVDERGDPITDYNINLFAKYSGKKKEEMVKVDVHSYSGDQSYRCFHINLDDLKLEELIGLRLEIIASSGTELLDYKGFIGERKSDNDHHDWTGSLDLGTLIGDENIKFFYPFTTTLVELKLNREPMPLFDKNKVAWFV